MRSQPRPTLYPYLDLIRQGRPLRGAQEVALIWLPNRK